MSYLSTQSMSMPNCIKIGTSRESVTGRRIYNIKMDNRRRKLFRFSYSKNYKSPNNRACLIYPLKISTSHPVWLIAKSQRATERAMYDISLKNHTRNEMMQQGTKAIDIAHRMSRLEWPPGKTDNLLHRQKCSRAMEWPFMQDSWQELDVRSSNSLRSARYAIMT